MITILVAAEGTDPNSKRYCTGFPVYAAPAGHIWGGAECPPTFVKVEITDTDDTTEWADTLTRKTEYAILAHEIGQDFFRVRIFATLKSPTADEMRAFLLNWGATEVADAAEGGVLFEITAMDGIRGKGLFSFAEEDAFVKYNEISYNPEAGTHEVELDYSISKLKAKDVQDTLTMAGMEILALDDVKGTCVFVGQRVKMISKLEWEVAQHFNIMLARVQWRFSSDTVMTALVRGGTVSMTMAEAEADMIDVATEI